MPMKNAPVHIWLTLLLLGSAAQAELRYYVAPDGSDQSAGSLDGPFASLEKARDTVRELSAEERRQVAVYFYVCVVS